jgi:drug/metabolite transporter (DMT)-like permease
MGRSALNGLTVIGLVFVVAGALVFATPVFQTHQTQNVAQLGDLKLQADQTKTYTIPPWLGGGALILGAALIAAGILRRP